MRSFQWDSHFETGLAEIDDQHRALVELINRFGDALGASSVETTDVTRVVFGELNAYARFHFRAEETLMEEARVDHRTLTEQRASHAEFCREIEALWEEETNDANTAAERLHRFLVDWLAYHILGEDKAMARQVAAIRGGISPPAAYDRHSHDVDDSIEPMVRALHGLFREVSQRNRALVRANRLLETRVEERTRELSEANRRLEQWAMTDPLTALPNRRHALSRLEAEWSASDARGRSPLSVMILDVDGFKPVNDSYGHDVGDAVLQAIAHRLRESVRSDDVVCRMGGDEFLIVCPATPLDGAAKAAEHVRYEVSGMRVPVGDGHWPASISVGVAVARPAMASHEALLKAADRALYEAKRRGGNCVGVATSDGARARRSADA